MAVSLYSLCSLNKIAGRDGVTGRTAHISLFGYTEGSGQYYFSGQEYSYPGSTLPQQEGLTEQATNQKNPFVKAAGVCVNAS